MPEKPQFSPIKIGSVVFDFSKTYVVGILNVTPDSFSDGGRFVQRDKAFIRAMEMISEGADIIDVGGESTRPGAEPVSLSEELDRVVPVIERLRADSEISISVDTYKSDVARKAIEAGADLINDISGLRFDSTMAETVAALGVPVVVMHMKGEPRSMQRNPVYGDLMGEICRCLNESVAIAERAGVARETIIVDPGIGFGKTFSHNFSILRHLGRLFEIGRPILVGASRKSFLGSLSSAGPADRLEESLAAGVIAACSGAHFVRVHDVAAAVRALRVCDAVKNAD